jgi:hypothetical protein
VGGWWMFFFGGKEAWRRTRRRSMKKKISSYVWRNVVHEGEVCKQRAWKEVCVASSCGGVHGRISMNEPLGSWFK